MNDETKQGVAYPRAWGAQVRCDDGQTETAQNGLNLRAPPLSRVALIRSSGGRWRIFNRPR